MKTIVVRYETKPECAEENRRLIEKVFTQLDDMAPEGFGYASFRRDDRRRGRLVPVLPKLI